MVCTSREFFVQCETLGKCRLHFGLPIQAIDPGQGQFVDPEHSVPTDSGPSLDPHGL
jgi:hypothetical protein